MGKYKMMEELLKEIEVGRNEEWIFYKTHFTESAENWARNKWKLNWIGVCLAREVVYGNETADLFSIPKANPESAYLIIDTRDNKPLREDTSYEGILYHIDFIGISKQFDAKNI
jgi:hypothetical protein